MIYIILTIIIVLILSAICSMVEASLFTVSINRVRGWVRRDVNSASILLSIKESIQKPIASIVILNNISNIVGSIIVGVLTTEYLDSPWIGLISGVFTFLVIIFSEIIPKTIGERYADKISLYGAKPIYWLTKMFYPILFLLGIMTKPFTGKKVYPSVSEDEIKVLATLGSRQGVLEKEEETIISNALILNDIKVKDIMTPRIIMESLDGSLLLKNAKNDILKSPFSRFPLYKENIDQVIGLLYKVDALIRLCEGDEDILLSELSREILFVPENKPIDKLMEELRISQSHTAVVVDEYGGTAGLVSLEDILEEIVGDIVNEGDTGEYHILEINDKEAIAHGFTLVEEVNKHFNTDIENHRTVGKMILDELNRFPNLKEVIQKGNLKFIVEELTPKTIERVRIELISPEEPNVNDKVD